MEWLFMKTMYTTNYKLYNHKNNEEFKVCLMNDLHYNEGTTNEKLKMILKKIEKLKPNYIMLLGDIIDSVNSINDLKTRKKLLLWLKDIGEVSKTLISLGSHDYCKKIKNPQKINDNWSFNNLNEYINDINSQKNVKVLHNTSYEDDKIFVTGYTQSIEYYNPTRDENSSIFTKSVEKKEIMRRELKTLRENITYIPKDKVNFIMIHSPIYLKDNDVNEYLKEYDYYLSGHMHNGLVPPIINELWPSSRGIMSPTRHFFADNCRNTLKYKSDKLIVNGPLSTFHDNHGLFSKFNFIYPSCISILDFTKDKEYDTDKIYTKRYYSK